MVCEDKRMRPVEPRSASGNARNVVDRRDNSPFAVTVASVVWWQLNNCDDDLKERHVRHGYIICLLAVIVINN